EPRDHLVAALTTALVIRAEVGRADLPWVIATASASVASARGKLRRPISACTMRAIWSLSARPDPETAFFTLAGGYDATRSPERPHTASTMPRACARASALRGFWCVNTSSTATTVGASS